VRNPRGQLFGGFTPTYVDLVALFTVRPMQWSLTLFVPRDSFGVGWLAVAAGNMSTAWSAR
jgi:hypothetical protein